MALSSTLTMLGSTASLSWSCLAKVGDCASSPSSVGSLFAGCVAAALAASRAACACCPLWRSAASSLLSVLTTSCTSSCLLLACLGADRAFPHCLHAVRDAKLRCSPQLHAQPPPCCAAFAADPATSA